MKLDQKFKLKLKDEFGINIFKGKDSIDRLNSNFATFLKEKGMLDEKRKTRRK